MGVIEDDGVVSDSEHDWFLYTRLSIAHERCCELEPEPEDYLSVCQEDFDRNEVVMARFSAMNGDTYNRTYSLMFGYAHVGAYLESVFR